MAQPGDGIEGMGRGPVGNDGMVTSYQLAATDATFMDNVAEGMDWLNEQALEGTVTPFEPYGVQDDGIMYLATARNADASERFIVELVVRNARPGECGRCLEPITVFERVARHTECEECRRLSRISAA